MALSGNREQRLYIATLCLTVLSSLLIICFIIIGVLWYIDKKKNLETNSLITSNNENNNLYLNEKVNLYKSSCRELIKQKYPNEPDSVDSKFQKMEDNIDSILKKKFGDQ